LIPSVCSKRDSHCRAYKFSNRYKCFYFGNNCCSSILYSDGCGS